LSVCHSHLSLRKNIPLHLSENSTIKDKPDINPMQT